MRRWWFWPVQDEGAVIVFDSQSLRFFKLRVEPGNILHHVMKGTPIADIAAETGLSEADVLALVDRLGATPRSNDITDRKPGPLTRLSLHVSHVCNMRCTCCYAKGGDYGHGPSMMSTKVAFAAVEMAKERFGGVRTIQFFGGEPLLNWPVVLSVCEYVNRPSRDHAGTPRLGVVTNLTRLPAGVEDVVNHCRLWITVSLDGPPEVNDRQRVFPDGSGSYHVVVENIRRLQEATPQPRAVEVTFTDTHKALGWTGDSLRRFFQNLGIEFVLISPVWDPSDPELAHSLLPLLESELPSPLGIMCQEVMDPRGLLDMLPLVVKRSSPYWCWAGLTSLTVTSTGDIFPCQLFLAHPEFRIGNVLDGTWSDAVVARLRENTKEADPACRVCEVRWTCRGCIATALALQGRLNPRDERFCASVRRLAAEALDRYAALLVADKATRQRIRTFVEAGLGPR